MDKIDGEDSDISVRDLFFFDGDAELGSIFSPGLFPEGLIPKRVSKMEGLLFNGVYTTAFKAKLMRLVLVFMILILFTLPLAWQLAT